MDGPAILESRGKPESLVKDPAGGFGTVNHSVILDTRFGYPLLAVPKGVSNAPGALGRFYAPDSEIIPEFIPVRGRGLARVFVPHQSDQFPGVRFRELQNAKSKLQGLDLDIAGGYRLMSRYLPGNHQRVIRFHLSRLR